MRPYVTYGLTVPSRKEMGGVGLQGLFECEEVFSRCMRPGNYEMAEAVQQLVSVSKIYIFICI